MGSFEETRNKYYTPEGIDALLVRLKSIYSIWKELPNEQYPMTFHMMGFPPLVLRSKEETQGHIHELQQILMVEITDETEQ